MRHFCRSLVVFAAAFVLATACSPVRLSAAGEWSQFRGPQGNGHAETTGLPVEWNETKNVAWKTPIPGQGHSSPVISDGQIWMTTAITEAPAPDVKKRKIAAAPNPRGLDVAGSVSMRAVCVDRATGKLLHDIEVLHVDDPQPIHSFNSYASPTPVIEDGRVYCHFGTYGTACLDADSGRVLWKNQELHADHQNGPGSSPVVWRDLLILHFDGIDVQYVAALDKHSGELVWKTDRSGELNPKKPFQKAYCTPTFIEKGGRTQMISPGADWVYSYDPATGEELWKANYGKLGFSTVPRPVVGHGLVYIATSYVRSALLAIRYDGRGDVTDTHVAWRYEKQVPKKPSLLLVGDELYFTSDMGIATCLDAETGERHWRARLDGQFAASPLYADGRIYFCDLEGKTTVIEPGTEYERITVNRLDEGCKASPAVAGKAIFLRTLTHLYRIEKPETTAAGQ